MEKKIYKDYIAPSLILVLICLVVTAALAQTYSVANPIIEKNASAAADTARAEVLPAGDSFTQYEGKLVTGVTECYVADNKTGMAVTATYKSFGGTLTTMVGIDKDGKVTGIKITGHTDTPGLGTKPMEADYLKEQYISKNAFAADHIKNDPEVDQIVGATISSNAIYQTVREAVQQYKECGGVK